MLLACMLQNNITSQKIICTLNWNLLPALFQMWMFLNPRFFIKMWAYLHCDNMWRHWSIGCKHRTESCNMGQMGILPNSHIWQWIVSAVIFNCSFMRQVIPTFISHKLLYHCFWISPLSSCVNFWWSVVCYLMGLNEMEIPVRKSEVQ